MLRPPGGTTSQDHSGGFSSSITALFSTFILDMSRIAGYKTTRELHMANLLLLSSQAPSATVFHSSAISAEPVCGHGGCGPSLDLGYTKFKSGVYHPC